MSTQRRTPPWGSPQQEIVAAETWDPAVEVVEPVAEAPEGETYQLVYEQSVGSGESIRWSTDPIGTRWPTRDAAREAALAACRTFDPRHPMSEQSRTILEISPDEYVVVVVGMTSTFHFRVSVARVVS